MSERKETESAHEAMIPGVAARVKGRILVADDNPDAAESLATLLELKGYEVRIARDGPEALQAAAEYQADAIFLDIAMPRLNGYDAARRIRHEPWGRRVTLIAVTGWCQEQDIQRSRDAGFDHHLTKPMNFARLDAILTGIADRISGQPNETATLT